MINFILITFTLICRTLVNSQDPDLNRNASEIIKNRGYTVWDYEITTSDGYILGVQRIPFSKDGSKETKPNSKVVLLHHGISESSLSWVINYRENSLAYVLADNGYDVWLANARGNIYSNRHEKLSIESQAFWNFTLDDIALIDLPTVIDFVLRNTSQEKLKYIGFSMGTTIAFMLLSTKPEYNDKIQIAAFLAPVAGVKYSTDPFKKISFMSSSIPLISNLMKQSGEFVEGKTLNQLCVKECTDNPDNCEKVFEQKWGVQPDFINKSRIAVYLKYSNEGTSLLAYSHYGQFAQSGKFHRYIWPNPQLGLLGIIPMGITVNSEDEYDVSKITCPVALYWSSDDQQADIKDVDILSRKLGNVLVEDYRVQNIPAEPFRMKEVQKERTEILAGKEKRNETLRWNHIVFMLAEQPQERLYQPLLKLLAKYP